MDTGKLGEKIAATYLIFKGYKILEKNKRTKRGEIDLICQKGKTLVFVEVKTRTSRLGGFPEEAVNKEKLRRLQSAIARYLQNKQTNNIESIRVDVISIEFSGVSLPHLYHIKNINFDH